MDVTAGLLAGLKLKGYKLIRLLGEGGGGAVFMASQLNTGQMVALKLLRRDAAAEPARIQRQIERFERETYLCAQLHHPHIVRLLDQGRTASQQLYAVFEFVPGETLKDLLLRQGPLSAPFSGALLGQVLDALACAHAQGIVHRDLKPQNIMVTSTGARTHVKVLDFGIAALIPARQADSRRSTVAEEMLGSPSYSAPEQLRGEPPTIKTDLYAWGLIFIECLTGKPAIEGATLAEVLHQQLSAAEVPIPAVLSGHPLGDLLRRVLRKNPAERAGRASSLYADFQRINLANIVGRQHRLLPDAAGADFPEQATAARTLEYQAGELGLLYECRQITVLCCTLNLTGAAGRAEKMETRDALQRDQLSLCIDIAARYGGHLAGTLGNSLMFYYGYPQVADHDARRAAHTALELVAQVRRCTPLLRQRGFMPEIRIGMHTGMVLVQDGHLPTGATPHIGLQLERFAQAGEVLLSASSHRLLEPHLICKDEVRVVDIGGGEMLACHSLSDAVAAPEMWRQCEGVPVPPLIGRESECAMLSKAWEAAKRQYGRPLLIRGEAGIGKSQLAEELRMAVQREGFQTCEYRCLPEHQHNALFPFLEILKQQLQWHAGDPPEQALARLITALERSGSQLHVLPVLCSWLALPPPAHFVASQIFADGQQQRLLDTLKKLILLGSNEQPFLLLIEDIQWIDPTSAELLRQLSAAIAQQRVLLLVTSRPQPVPLIDLPEAGLISLERLPDALCAELICNIIGSQSIDAALLRHLCQRSDGIPLFVEELTRMLLENKLLMQSDGVYQLAGHYAMEDIPVTLRELLSARLAHLGNARETAQLAALIGREFDHALLSRITPADDARLQADLDQLAAVGLIHRQGKDGGDRYIFKHALIRDAVCDALPEPYRAQVQADIARYSGTLSDPHGLGFERAAWPSASASSENPVLCNRTGSGKTHRWASRDWQDELGRLIWQGMRMSGCGHLMPMARLSRCQPQLYRCLMPVPN